MPIPRLIHFCWLSGEERPLKVEQCLASWQRHLVNYHLGSGKFRHRISTFCRRGVRGPALGFRCRLYPAVGTLSLRRSLPRFRCLRTQIARPVSGSSDIFIGGVSYSAVLRRLKTEEQAGGYGGDGYRGGCDRSRNEASVY